MAPGAAGPSLPQATGEVDNACSALTRWEASIQFSRWGRITLATRQSWGDSNSSSMATFCGPKKINDPVSEFIFHVFNWAPHSRVLLQHFDTLADSLHGAFCSVKVLGLEEVVEPLDIQQRCRRPHQA